VQIRAAWRTDKGLKRDSNQDSCLCDDEALLYIVADGMGGHSGGEVASKMAVDLMRDYIHAHLKSRQLPKDILIKAYAKASESIYQKAQKEGPHLSGMGTTVVCLWGHENKIFIGNVGDSRCYLFSEAQLWQLTEDHSLLNEQVRAGILTDEQIKTMSGKNVITRSVGYESAVSVDVIEREAVSGDRYLLCSDGLSSLVPQEIIANVLRNNEFDLIPELLVDAALKHGGDDNVTVLGLKVE
jgi:protein phosphatase